MRQEVACLSRLPHAGHEEWSADSLVSHSEFPELRTHGSPIRRDKVRQAGVAFGLHATRPGHADSRSAPVEATLWTWAWSRFPELVHDGLPGVDETTEVEVALKDGRTFTGYPDNRESSHGQLVLLGRASAVGTQLEPLGPFSIDDVASVRKAGRTA